MGSEMCIRDSAWARPPSHVAAADTPLLRAPAHARHALVIGAGLAGTAITERLAARGWRIDPVSYTHLTLPTIHYKCRSRGWPGE
nr:hypothetical protein [Herbaspirillum sp. ASV7]